MGWASGAIFCVLFRGTIKVWRPTGHWGRPALSSSNARSNWRGVGDRVKPIEQNNRIEIDNLKVTHLVSQNNEMRWIVWNDAVQHIVPCNRHYNLILEIYLVIEKWCIFQRICQQCFSMQHSSAALHWDLVLSMQHSSFHDFFQISNFKNQIVMMLQSTKIVLYSAIPQYKCMEVLWIHWWVFYCTYRENFPYE